MPWVNGLMLLPFCLSIFAIFQIPFRIGYAESYNIILIRSEVDVEVSACSKRLEVRIIHSYRYIKVDTSTLNFLLEVSACSKCLYYSPTWNRVLDPRLFHLHSQLSHHKPLNKRQKTCGKRVRVSDEFVENYLLCP